MSYIKFESSRAKEIERNEKKRAREAVLAKAEAKYNSRKVTKEKEKWMLPSVEERIKSESSKEKRKHKKKKKAKRKKKSSSSDSSDESDEEWVEKVVDKESDKSCSTDNDQVKQEGSSGSQRDEWMSLTGLFPCVTREESKCNKKEVEKQNSDKYMLDRLGQTDRELNPYWKDGGTGLPQEEESGKQSKDPTLAQKSVGDQGVDWLRRALKRAKEQAAEEGRSLEEIAAERWGSLQNLETMLAEAEEKRQSGRRQNEDSRDRRDRGEIYDRHRYSGKERDLYDNERRKSSGSKYAKPDNKDKDYSFSSSNRRFQKPKDESGMPREFHKPKESEFDTSTYRRTSGSGNWRKKSSANEAQQSSQKIQETHRKNVSSTSSSDSELEETRPKEKTPPSSVLSDKEMNDLGAKLVKAEILGNKELANELKRKLEAARAARALKPESATEEEIVVLTRRDSRGFVHPLQQGETSGRPEKKRKVETHKDGSRVRYFADDDKYSLQDLFEREKLTSVEDQNEMFSKLIGKGGQNMDDIFEETARIKESTSKIEAREKNRAMSEHKKVDRVLSNCNWCFDSKEMLKHLIVAIGTKVYLCLPPHQSLTEGHCLIVPMFHTPCTTQLDEDVWNEMQTFKKTLVKLFKDRDEDVVFFETAIFLKKFPHMLIECVPMAKEIGDLAPIYFKKAILECETEWATNKKLVDLKGKDVRRAVPKGLPYFTVDFGLDPGFAHVVEDEKIFPRNFAQEIIGGMLDLDHSVWRKQRRENFEAQRKKVMQFGEWWKPYDFTVKNNSSDSD